MEILFFIYVMGITKLDIRGMKVELIAFQKMYVRARCLRCLSRLVWYVYVKFIQIHTYLGLRGAVLQFQGDSHTPRCT